jgi:hypothetical protein
MKLVVLVVSVIGSGLILLRGSTIDPQLCEAFDRSCPLFFSNIWRVSFFFPLVLLFSLMTYRLPIRIFRIWFNFLLGWGSLTLLLTTIIHMGYFGFQDDVYVRAIGMLLIYTMYTIFILGSIISIVRGYNSNRSLK